MQLVRQEVMIIECFIDSVRDEVIRDWRKPRLRNCKRSIVNDGEETIEVVGVIVCTHEQVDPAQAITERFHRLY
jgi:hypothetical protein